MRFERVGGGQKPPTRRIEAKRAPRSLPREPLPPERRPTRGPSARPDRMHVRPWSYVLLSLLFSILLFGFFYVSDRGFLAVSRQRRQLVDLQAEISTLNAENLQLEKEVSRLATDSKAVEKIAREDLGLVRPDDIVLMLPPGWKTRVTPGAHRWKKGGPPASKR